MAMTLEELQILITTETSGLRAEIEKVKKELTSLDKSVKSTVDNIKNAFSKVKTTLAALGIGATIRSATKEAMNFEAAVQQIQRLMGSSAGVFQQWANENAAAFGMARSEAIRYGAVYANLLSSFTNSTAQTAQYTQDLLQASAVVASYTGRTMEDVMERIRSGLLGNTEAIEDLGINVNIAMIEATDAFRQFANGKSWAQLDFRTQQTIRYFAIMEQAARKYGNELAQNTATRHAAFIAQLKDLQLALGQAFLPIYNAVLPALTQLAASLAEVMRFVAAFLQAFFGYNPQNQARQITQQSQAVSDQAAAVSGLGDAYEKARKKAKLALASFDEVHQLDVGDADSGASAGVGIPLGGIEGGVIGDAFSSVSEKAREMAEKLKEVLNSIKDFFVNNKDIIVLALEAMALNMLRTALNAGKLGEAAKLLSGNLAKLREAMKNTVLGRWFAETFLPWMKESPLLSLFKRVQEGVAKAVEVVRTKADEMAKALDLSKIFAAFRESTIVQKVIAIFSTIQSKIKEFTAFLKDNAIVRFFAEIGSKIAGFAQQVGGKLAEISAFIARLVAPFRVVWEWIVKTFEWVLKLWEVLTKIPVLGPLLQLAGRFAGILGWILLIVDAAKAAIWVFQNWEKIPEILAQKWDQFKQWMIDLWENISAWLAEKWDGIKTAAVEAWEGISEGISNWWGNIKNGTIQAWNDINSWLSQQWNNLKTNVLNVWQTLGATVTTWWNNIKNTTLQIWTDVINRLSQIWNDIKNKVLTVWQTLWNTVSTWWNNIKNGTIQVWTSITGWLSQQWNNIKTTAFTVWNNIKTTIVNLITNVKTNLVSTWNNIKTTLSNIWNNISSTASQVWNKMKGIIKDAINGIIDIINLFIRSLNKLRIEVPKKNIPGIGQVGGFSIGFDINELERLAKGGIVQKPTVALIGEAGKEAVIPLERDNILAQSIGQSVYQAMAMALRMNQISGAQSGGEEQREVVLRIDGTTFARAVMPYIIREGQRRGLNLRPQTGV